MTTDAQPSRIWYLVALIIAAATSAGSMWLSIGMGLKPCPLCYYERTFAMAALGVLLMGLLTGQGRHAGSLALPLALAGMGIAGFHVYLEISGKLECPDGVLGFGSAPQQSLAGLVLMSIFLGMDALASRRASEEQASGGLALVVAFLVGAALAIGCIKSAPPLPKAPTEPYDPVKKPFVGCRPPYVGGGAQK